MKYIIGPSHMGSNYTYVVADEIKNKILFDDCILDAYPGLPVWSKHLYTCIRDNFQKNNEVYWLVSDYKFNNFDYDTIIELQKENELFIDTKGSPGNVSRDFLEEHHIETLGNHALQVIDFIIREFPAIKLIFWCLYKRTKANADSSYPKHLWYDEIKKRYQKNIIDIDLFTTPEEFNNQIIDEGAHPNADGFRLLNSMFVT